MAVFKVRFRPNWSADASIRGSLRVGSSLNIFLAKSLKSILGGGWKFLEAIYLALPNQS